MNEERRYSDAEVEEILRRATERRGELARPASGQDGLTLGELQAIGREVGIPPNAMAEAARSLTRPPAVHRTLGLPLAVGHRVPLSRDLTEAEWEHLLADLRETFRARGQVRVHGRIREWSNGNLHALVEPTPDGWRLRMGTTKGSARPLLGMGAAMLGLAVVFWIVALLGLGDGDLAGGATTLVAMGTAFLAGGAVQLPGWSRERRRQMEEVGARLVARLDAPPPRDP